MQKSINAQLRNRNSTQTPISHPGHHLAPISRNGAPATLSYYRGGGGDDADDEFNSIALNLNQNSGLGNCGGG